MSGEVSKNITRSRSPPITGRKEFALAHESNETVKRRKLTCPKCNTHFEFYQSEHITLDTRKKHFSREDNVLCITCHEHRSKYTCSRCGQTGSREKFQKTNFNQDGRRGTQQCLECKSGICKCEICGQQCLQCKSGIRKGKICVIEHCKTFGYEYNLRTATGYFLP